MPVRGKFEDELKELQDKLVKLVAIADNALDLAMKALETHDVDLALKVMEDDTVANMLYEEIDDFAILLIAKQQPVAIDLRRIIVSIKIASDLERISDFAKNIAKSTIRIGQEEHLKEIIRLKKMYRITSSMLKDALKAYQEEDLGLAKKVADLDNEVDSLYGEVIKDLFALNNEKSENYDQIVQMLFINRYLERAADHITNIAEHVFYMVKGKHYDLNE
ncbi:phosphate signaling complex protein PhoU [Niallia sp. Krafla_26]|uniref:phosphate signaling complex protein PhoU n=1 Tax=Niallia sp. Krafla_26 TaxID=3064703 RepID=UPI003D16EED4